jgi:membrane associated rhomboid family serine protease
MTSRFRFSAPDSRGPSDPWFRIGTLEVTTTVFVVLLGVVAMFLWAIDPRIIDPLLLLSGKVRHGEVWRIVTWPAYNPPSLSAVISIAIFWWFGRDMESLFGRRRFLWFLLAITIIPGLVATALSLDQGTLRFIELGVFVAFSAEHPNARFFFGIPAWVIAAVIVGIDILQMAGLRQGDRIVFLLVVCLVSLLVLRAYGFGEVLARFIPQIKLPGVGGARTTTRRPRRGSPSPEPRPVVVQGPWQPTSPDEIARQARIDSLLDKIAATGLDSLTADERKWLNDASKRSRDDRR